MGLHCLQMNELTAYDDVNEGEVRGEQAAGVDKLCVHHE
jgi:hypothetical protein